MGQKVLVIVGPTASGKSALGVALAKMFRGEIISADSRQVYRGLDIGTGKITKKEMRGVTHHLLDIASPKKTVTAHEFAEKARAMIKKIAAKDSLPMVVGGTGFYIDALMGRIDVPNVPPDKKLRARLQKKTVLQLYSMLKKRDPRRARSMNTPSERNNKVRLIRAIEVAMAKQPKSSAANLPLLDALWIGIAPPTKELERKIVVRLRARIKKGMLAEGRRLHAHGLSFKRMEELGLEYRSLSRSLQKKITPTEFEAELSRDIRRYAKKQLTYWKRNKDIRWFVPTDSKKIERTIARWLTARKAR